MRSFAFESGCYSAVPHIECRTNIHGAGMAKMRAVQVAKAGGPLELVEKEIPTPPAGSRAREGARVRHLPQRCAHRRGALAGHQPIRACPATRRQAWSTRSGAGVLGWKAGDRVGIGWYGGSCGYCDRAVAATSWPVSINPQVSGISCDGGYAEYIVVPKEALALIPDELSFVDAGPLMCAGVTTFNSLRNSGARAGDLVAVHGIGGPRPSRRAVRGAHGLPHRRDRARRGQGGAREEARRARVH